MDFVRVEHAKTAIAKESALFWRWSVLWRSI